MLVIFSMVMAGVLKNIPVTLNVCDRRAIQEVVNKIQQQDGHIDVLVNNAGVTRDNLINKMTEQDWDLVIDINLKGVFNMTRAVAPIMMENNTGSIITMSSVVGTDGNIGQSNYAATKGGVIAMTKGWAKEFARKGAKVRANCVAPGFVVTPMTKDLPEKVIDHMIAKTPLGPWQLRKTLPTVPCSSPAKNRALLPVRR